MKAAIVVPTIREKNIIDFLSAWSEEFSTHDVVVVEDNPEKSFEISGPNIRHFCWSDIDEELGRESWIIPRRTDCIRSFGYLKALDTAPDMIVTLDDDCYPREALSKPTPASAGKCLGFDWTRSAAQRYAVFRVISIG
jgi:Reversibly glycosylated polypeptide